MTTATTRPVRKKSVLLVDDHPVVRDGLARCIEAQADLKICGEASQRAEALGMADKLCPDVIITDLSLPEPSGLELVKDLKIRFPEIPVLVLSIHDESLYAERVLRAGASGYVMKHESTANILGAIRQVLRGQVFLSDRMSQLLLRTVTTTKGAAGAESPVKRLSDRELQVFELIGRGLRTGEIARKLHVSVKTVETHRAHLKEKLNLKDAAELARLAVHWADKL